MAFGLKFYQDPSAEVAEPHLLLEENSFPASSIIPKNDDPKRVDALIEAMHADLFEREIDHQQKASFQTTTTSIEQENPSKRSLRASRVNFELPSRDSIPNDRPLENLDEPSPDPPTFPSLDLEQLVRDRSTEGRTLSPICRL